MRIFNKIRELGTRCWALGFVRGGMDAVMKGSSPIGDCKLEIGDLQVDWVKMPDDRWYADPFVLDVTESEILLLVEDYPYATEKGVISLLHINRSSMEIIERKVLLELPTHLSFPAIWRKDEHIYVYPESAKSGKLDMYEYDPAKEELTYVQTICNDAIWDSYITEVFGEPLLFTAEKDDYQLDIYKWNDQKKRFVPDIVIPSEIKNSRLGGAVFEYNGEYYYPAQNCEKAYGGAIDIKRLEIGDSIEDRRLKIEDLKVECVKHLESPHPKYQLGMHTLNEYKGVVVIDVHGYRHSIVGPVIASLVRLKKKLRHG